MRASTWRRVPLCPHADVVNRKAATDGYKELHRVTGSVEALPPSLHFASRCDAIRRFCFLPLQNQHSSLRWGVTLACSDLSPSAHFWKLFWCWWWNRASLQSAFIFFLPVPKCLVKQNKQAAGINFASFRWLLSSSQCCSWCTWRVKGCRRRSVLRPHSRSHSQFASFCLWLLASVREREIYIDLSGCLHCSRQKVDRRCFTKEIKEPAQATRRAREHENTELERHTGCTPLNKYDCCVDNVSECRYHFDGQHNSFPFSTVLEYQTSSEVTPKSFMYHQSALLGWTVPLRLCNSVNVFSFLLITSKKCFTTSGSKSKPLQIKRHNTLFVFSLHMNQCVWIWQRPRVWYHSRKTN